MDTVTQPINHELAKKAIDCDEEEANREEEEEDEDIGSRDPIQGTLDSYYYDDDGGEDQAEWDPEEQGLDDEAKTLVSGLLKEVSWDDIANQKWMADLLLNLRFPDSAAANVVKEGRPLHEDEPDVQRAVYDLDESFFADAIPHDFVIKLSLFVSTSNISRKQYEGLAPLLNAHLPKHLRIPISLRGLHSWRKNLPRTTVMGTRVKVETDALPGKGPNQKNPTDILYHTKSIPLTKALAANPQIQQIAYFGMMKLVDDPKEFYHTPAIGESVINTSGEFAFYPDQKDTPVMPGDVICYGEGGRRKGLVSLVCKDERSGGNGRLLAKIQIIVSFSSVVDHLCDGYGKGLSTYIQQDPVADFIQQVRFLENCDFDLGSYEAEDLVLWEDICVEEYVPIDEVVGGPRTPIFTDGFPAVFNSLEEAQAVPDPLGRPASRPRIFIALIIDTFRRVTVKRSLNRAPFRAEVEIAARGYTNIIETFVRGS